MIKTWDDLKFWDSGEWQVIEEKLDDLTKAKISWNPGKRNLFKALKATPFETCKVIICGQDPYPDHTYSTGVAFSVPPEVSIPPTLDMIFKEYCNDLHYPYPSNGNLTKWTDQGVLLWNVIPSCLEGKSLSHDWEEWNYLTAEIIKELDEVGVVFVFLGSRARNFASLVSDNSYVIETAHPSPRASIKAVHPFPGSRIFSRINDNLFEPVDWRL